MTLYAVGSEPWANEPDREEWTSPGGSRCLVWRSALGSLSGYVAVPVGHPWHGLARHAVPACMHGGCTWVGPLPDTGETWWIGFDCGHVGQGDIVPAFVRLPSRLPKHLADLLFKGREYRDLAYVKRETDALAVQAEQAARLERGAN